ncbi:MAG: SRPBCC family protein [Planctomycetota bacterium]
MTRIAVERAIDAPPEVVFAAVADIEHLPDVSEDVVGIEFLTEQRFGVGTRFRETRRMGKRTMDTDLEVTEYDPPHRVRMVTDSHGTVWDTVFRITETAGGAHLEIDMDARPHALLPRIMNPLMKPMFRRGMQKHIDTLAEHCARRAAQD